MMKMTTVAALLLSLLVLPVFETKATEIFSEATIGNLGFSRDRKPASQGLPADNFPWGFSLGVRHGAFETIDIELALRRDPVIGNTTDLLFVHQADFVELSVGPYLGIYNTDEKPFLILPGVSAGLKFNLGSVGFVALNARAPLSDEPSSEGDYRQMSREYEVGLFVPNVTLSVFHGRYTFEEMIDIGPVKDEKTVSELRAHVYQKNVPYEIELSFGYHDYQKIFVNADQIFGALVLGTGVKSTVSPRVQVLLRLESALYAFGRKDLLGDESGSSYFFRVSAGTRITLSDN